MRPQASVFLRILALQEVLDLGGFGFLAGLILSCLLPARENMPFPGNGIYHTDFLPC